MDAECASLLPGVCEVLAASASSLPDDTSLEKLLDWFTGLSEAGGSLLDACPCLLDFISSVVHNAASDPGVLSFTLRLTGLMAATEDGFGRLQERSVLSQVFGRQRWQDAGLWEDPCFRIGWIQGLRSMLQHPEALGFFVQSDFIDPLLRLQTDASLFVASAANQMLAHVLLSFQDGERTRSSAEYASVVTAISEHLKVSLVPQKYTELRQSLQVLKLLALVLARAGPPLWDRLLQAVADSLEELAAAGCSQLTLPLMDVILAARIRPGADEHVPDRRVSRLLVAMLDVDKPADLVHAAAAFLRRGPRDGVHTARAVGILLLPLHIVTGQSLLGTNTTDERRASVAEQLKCKSFCISVICVCLTNTPQITLTPSGNLPCPPQLIVTAVLSLLRICSGASSSPSSSSSPSTGCSEVSRNVIGSGKVQKCALEALTALSSSPGAKEAISEVFTVLMQYLDNPDSDATVLHKSYQAFVRWMSVSTDTSFATDQLRRGLEEVVKKRVCDMRWEVRDSTVEFLGHLAGGRVSVASAEEEEEEEEEAPGALLGVRCTTLLLKEALQDTESYVRASAVSALAKMLTPSWQQGAPLGQEETETVSRLLEILSRDTEAFPRRAVVRYFISWFSSSSSSSSSSLLAQCVRSVLSQGSADLDWEVKVHTLELAELLLDEAFSGDRGYRDGVASSSSDRTPESRLAGVVELGVVPALLSGLVDCDRPVGLRACRLLTALRDAVGPPAPGAPDTTCPLPRRGWGEEIRKTLGMKRRDTEAEEGIEGGGASEGGDAVSVCEALAALGLDERLKVLARSSDHVHNSPLSLLQDILTASAARTHPDTQPGQEVIVDCY
ncbi:BRCA1-associated ATM activator 1 isoform X2 [Pseudoliparis swirei]|uniref:BRCA1-associated ATM activator 1 isoform X2 n=1 Tax=Pseudoliparis swirei TaxID=2059687 RepID=UPI0024BDDAAD|nr:BRCA1-associated ATM activator 1 isoform X2 [Pseudoliparis swirei]